MPYTPQTWSDLPSQTTPITAARLSHMETQYAAVAADIDDPATPVGTAIAAQPVSTATQAALDLKQDESAMDASVAQQVESGPLTGAALDAATAALVVDSGSDTAGELNAAYGPTAAGMTATFAPGVVKHGGVAGTARPAVSIAVEWQGSVVPTAALAGDRWWDTSTDLWKRYNGTSWRASGSREKSLQASAPPQNWYQQARYGLFSHYTYGSPTYPETIYRDGTHPVSVTELAANFDVARYVADAASFGVDYLTITTWHYAMNALYPSTVLASYLPGHTSTRDVIQEIIDAAKPLGIRVMLYIHLTDGHDLTAEEQTATGWNDATNNYAAWGTFINALVTELGQRYTTDIDGFWVDMARSPEFDTHLYDKAALRASLLAGHGGRVIVGNAANDSTPPGVGGGALDFASREYISSRPASILDWTAGTNQTLIYGTNVTNYWWAVKVQGTGAAVTWTAEQMFRFTVLQAGSNTQGGGMCWNMSPYVGISAGTSLWEDGVETTMKAIAAYIAPLASSLKGVIASGSYITPTTATLNSNAGYVATTSADALTEYIHVLTDPGAGLPLTLPAPSDGVNFTSARNLATGRSVRIDPTPTGGYKLTLHPSDSWSATDTVIALVRETKIGEILAIQPTGITSNGPNAIFEAQGGGSRFAVWKMSPTVNSQVQANFTPPAHWKTFAVDLQGYAVDTGTGQLVELFIARSEAVDGVVLTAGDQIAPSQTYIVPTALNMPDTFTVFPTLKNTPNSLNHIRIGRNAVSGGDTAGTFGVLRIVLRRLT